MSVPASTVLVTARTFLNDDAGNLWTDQSLMPKLAQAHRELQVALRAASAPVMRAMVTSPVNALATYPLVPPTDIVEPVTLWEKDPAQTDDTYVRMTEYDPLPITTATNRLIYWQWTNEQILFLGSTTARTVRILYTRSLPIPTAVTDLVGFINGELYLAPRTAAIAAASVGQKEMMGWATDLAMTAIQQVILANRGRGLPGAGQTSRP